MSDKSGKWGFADSTGRVVIDFIFDEVLDFRPDGVARIEIKRRWGYVNLRGNFLREPDRE